MIDYSDVEDALVTRIQANVTDATVRAVVEPQQAPDGSERYVEVILAPPFRVKEVAAINQVVTIGWEIEFYTIGIARSAGTAVADARLGLLGAYQLAAEIRSALIGHQPLLGGAANVYPILPSEENYYGVDVARFGVAARWMLRLTEQKEIS